MQIYLCFRIEGLPDEYKRDIDIGTLNVEKLKR